MRWVLMLLVAANIGYFLWQAWFAPAPADNDATAPVVLDASVPRLQLIDEPDHPAPPGESGPVETGQPVEPQSEVAGTEEPAAAELVPETAPAEEGLPDQAPEDEVLALEEPAAEAVDESTEIAEPTAEPVVTQQAVRRVVEEGSGEEVADPLCWMVGPMPEKVTGRQVAARFQALELDMRLVNTEVVVGQKFQVHLGPYPSQGEAMAKLRELQAAGIDSYIQASGELKNSVSLGYFSHQSSADSAVEQFVAKGYAPKVATKDQKELQIWGILPVSEAAGLGEDFWAGISKDFPGVGRKQNLCAAIASVGILE